MSETIFCVSCDSREDKNKCTTICNSCLDLSFRAKAQWISVKDRLPTENKRYVVIHLDDHNAWNDDRLGFSSFFTETNEFNHDNIGWWFNIPPLPELPK